MTPKTERVDKLTGGRRVLNAALNLWFADGDPLAVHTLAAASHGVLADLCRHRGISDKLFDSALVKEEHRKLWIKKVRGPANFLKHADEDPVSELEFNPVLNDLRMMFCLWCLRELGAPQNTLEHAFAVRIGLEYPHFLSEDMFQGTGATDRDVAELRALTRAKFLEVHHTASRFAKAGFNIKVVG
jgi:hypothetical protein